MLHSLEKNVTSSPGKGTTSDASFSDWYRYRTGDRAPVEQLIDQVILNAVENGTEH
jgi:hypothetical protein